MIPQPQFNERSKNQIKSNKEIPSSPAASSLLPLPTQPAALESIKEIGAEQLCPCTAKHKVKHMKYATHSAFPLLFSLAHCKGQWQAQRETSRDVQHLLQSPLTRQQPQLPWTQQHKSCGACLACPWARLSFPWPSSAVGTSNAKPTSHGKKYFIQMSLSTPSTPATTAKC